MIGEECHVVSSYDSTGYAHCEFRRRSAGSAISYPIGVQRQVVNSGKYPLTYVLIAATLD
jgi:hypothetical protein